MSGKTGRVELYGFRKTIDTDHKVEFTNIDARVDDPYQITGTQKNDDWWIIDFEFEDGMSGDTWGDGYESKEDVEETIRRIITTLHEDGYQTAWSGELAESS